jgi:hypothetical protein
MDLGFLTDPHTLYVVCGLVVIVLLRYAFHRPPPRKPPGKRFADIQAKARSAGAEARITAEAEADKTFDDQEAEEAKLC